MLLTPADLGFPEKLDQSSTGLRGSGERSVAVGFMARRIDSYCWLGKGLAAKLAGRTAAHLLAQSTSQRPRSSSAARQALLLSNQGLEAGGMAEKGLRTGAGAVGAGLKDHHQIPRFGDGQFHPVGEQVERGA